ncbi:MAG: preprotein translocase subunit SecE [Lachnospiraceae bacterium]|nr:preprotein translocase subunit SecE [Lachnospiraceae bacterium]
MGDSVEKQTKTTKDTKSATTKKTSFWSGVKSEFKKISWPDRQSTLKQSVAVVTISVVLGLIIAVLDVAIQYGLNFLTSL